MTWMLHFHGFYDHNLAITWLYDINIEFALFVWHIFCDCSSTMTLFLRFLSARRYLWLLVCHDTSPEFEFENVIIHEFFQYNDTILGIFTLSSSRLTRARVPATRLANLSSFSFKSSSSCCLEQVGSVVYCHSIKKGAKRAPICALINRCMLNSCCWNLQITIIGHCNWIVSATWVNDWL